MNKAEMNDKIIRSLLKLLNARNKVLWEGSWKSGSITVPDTDKYSMFEVTIASRKAICSINANVISGIIVNMAANNYTQYINAFTATMSGNVWTLIKAIQQSHTPSGGHSTGTDIAITKIVGIEPIPAKIMSGGGYCNRIVSALRRIFDRGCVA